MQLSSPMLPVGAYAYSQGLEYAVACRWVEDESSAEDWIFGLMGHTLLKLDVPVLARIHHAWRSNDEPLARSWSEYLYAARDSAELQAEDRQMGQALARLLADLGLPEAAVWAAWPRTCFLSLFGLAAARWGIAPDKAACGYLWAWAENQVTAAIKLVPLGQTAGQKILSTAAVAIPDVVRSGLALEDGEIGFTAPMHAMAGALHETQYTRLFRS
ncbi:MAG: urease accessory protein UreF [Nitrospinales bacterium]